MRAKRKGKYFFYSILFIDFFCINVLKLAWGSRVKTKSFKKKKDKSLILRKLKEREEKDEIKSSRSKLFCLHKSLEENKNGIKITKQQKEDYSHEIVSAQTFDNQEKGNPIENNLNYSPLRNKSDK